MTQPTDPIFDAKVRIDRLPAAGRDLDLALDAPTRAALAQSLRLSAVETFETRLVVAPFRGGIRARGHLRARIVQPSVVSFEPVAQDIDEPVDRVFLPDAPGGHIPVTSGQEVFVDLEDDDFPDHLDGPEVDLSALLVEVLALAIDPYPRQPGETLDALGLNAEGEASGPFAGLAKLKKSTDV